MASLGYPSSCLLNLHKSRPQTAFSSSSKAPRYFFFQPRREPTPCKALDEEGYYVKEDHGYIHPRYPFSHQFNPVDERTLAQKLADQLQKITPIKAVKFATFGALFLTLTEWLLASIVFNPRFWTYAGWLMVFWPWLLALALATGTCYLAHKRLTRWDDRSYKTFQKDRDTTLLIAGSLVWLILVPLGHFQGYVEGYPAIFYTVYFTYFIFDRFIRMRVYGKRYTDPEDEEWRIPVDRATWFGFLGAVVAGHWLAAFEAPPMMLSWRFGWQTGAAVLMAAVALAMKYYGTYFLLKFSKKVNNPNIAVPFGPYRWVRHPVYGSSILLFSALCMALRAYGSLCLILAGCLFYYEQLTRREEEMLLKHFGEEYSQYMKSVRHKYVPYVY